MNRSVNGVRDAWYSSGRVVASAPHGPETGFEEKSIPPRKLAGQMNGDTTNRPSGWFPQRRDRL